MRWQHLSVQKTELLVRTIELSKVPWGRSCRGSAEVYGTWRGFTEGQRHVCPTCSVEPIKFPKVIGRMLDLLLQQPSIRRSETKQEANYFREIVAVISGNHRKNRRANGADKQGQKYYKLQNFLQSSNNDAWLLKSIKRVSIACAFIYSTGCYKDVTF